MDNNLNNSITPFEFISIIVGIVINVELLSLPVNTAKISLQDAWISTAVGGVYPIYICILCCFISKRHPNENILCLSTKYLGKILGTIFNILFLFHFLILITFSVSSYANICRVYSVPFLSRYTIIFITIGISIYWGLKKIKSIGKISTIVFFLTIILILFPLININKGSIINICPIMGSGYKKILLGSLKTIYPYLGIDIILLLYPLVTDKKKIVKSLLVSPVLLITFYTFIVFITIYILDPDITIKGFWPFITATEGIKFPITSSFRFFFIYLWSFVAFDSFVIAFFTTFEIYKYSFKKNVSYPILFFIFISISLLSVLLSNEADQQILLTYLAPLQAIFSIVYVSIISLFVLVKG